MAVNLKSVMLASKCAILAIINIASVAGMRALSRTPYSVSKEAVVALTKFMAGGHGKDNIRVNAIVPGLIYTPIYTPMVVTRMTGKV
jgi:NAD(P)-dependent dehydrogenase (short-subunit alcohol dehydrogenase family)